MRFLSMLFPIILAVLIALSGIGMLSGYPMPPDNVAAEKYDRFSGVLTISFEKSLTEEFPGLHRWLTEITNLFEKHNRGIYLRLAEIPDGKLHTAVQGAQPADIVLCRAGALPKLSWRKPDLSRNFPAFQGDPLALPIAAGGYLLGFSGDPPTDLDVLPDGTIGWNDELSTPWIALCEQFSRISTQKRTVSPPDIGLIPTETPQPSLLPDAGTRFSRHHLQEGNTNELFEAFLSGDLRALPLTEIQAAKICRMQEDGRCSNIRFLNSAAYTDRVVYAAIPVSGRSDADARAEEASRFLSFLTDETAQTQLTRHGLFPVAPAGTDLPIPSGLKAIADALRRSDCVVQGADESAIRMDTDAFLDGTIPARELMRTLRNERMRTGR